jgi:hypothetical protein
MDLVIGKTIELLVVAILVAIAARRLRLLGAHKSNQSHRFNWGP